MIALVVLALFGAAVGSHDIALDRVRHFEALSLFGSTQSEFWTLTNGHPGPSSYQLKAFDDRSYGHSIAYGGYTKGAFSASGGVDLKLVSDMDDIVVSANIVPGSFYMMYLYSNEGQTPPQLAVYEFTGASFETALSSGLATIFFTNLVRLRDMQIFVNGVLFVNLPAPEHGKDPVIPQPLTLDSANFNAIVELYDVSDPNEKVLTVRGQLQLEAKKVYICHVMGDPQNQNAYPYTMAIYRHSLSGAFRMLPPSYLLQTALALVVIASFC